MNVLLYIEGEPPWLEYCVASIKARTPGAIVHVLRPPFASGMADELRAAYETYQRESGDVGYPARNMTRWPIFLDYARANSITEFFACDCDVLCFDDLSAIRYASPIVGHAHMTWVYDLGALEAFCRFMLEFFSQRDTNEWELLRTAVEHGKLAGVGNMVCWDRWASRNDGENVLMECFAVARGSTCDWNICDWNIGSRNSCAWNICASKGWINNGRRKIITFRDGHPFGTTNLGEEVRFRLLHCWGPYKERMADILQQAEASKGSDERREFLP